jgi:ABC-type transport system involved in multi-copper enzyme maturation permease subunit
LSTLALIQLTFRESLAKKTFIGFFGISTFVCLLFVFALNLDIVDGAQSYVTIFGAEVDQAFDIQNILMGLEGGLAGILFVAGIFLSLFATSSLIPSLLQPGSIDILISKPLSRTQILLGKYLGAISIVACNIFYMIIASWLIISIKTALWNWGFLLAGVMIVLTFAILFSLMTFLSVTTRSGPFSLMITYLIFFLSAPLLARDQIYALLSSKVYGYILDGLYYYLPRVAELGNTTQILVRGHTDFSWSPILTSTFFAITMLSASAFIFSKKNF